MASSITFDHICMASLYLYFLTFLYACAVFCLFLGNYTVVRITEFFILLLMENTVLFGEKVYVEIKKKNLRQWSQNATWGT